MTDRLQVVLFVTDDCEGTFTDPIGIASSPEHAEAITAEHKRLLLALRNARMRCALCGFYREVHDPANEVYQYFKANELTLRPHDRFPHDHEFVDPPPITELLINEGYEFTEFDIDALPVEP